MEDRSNAEWMVRFEADLKRRFHDRSTAKHYMSDLRLFVQFHPGPLGEVTRGDVDAFVDQQHTLGLAPATVKRRVAALKSFFDFLADELGQVGRPNPVSMRRHAGRQPKLLPRDLSDAEVSRLLAVIKQPRDLAMVALMLYAGLRVGEVANLCRADISSDEGEASPVRLRVMGKGRKERVVYLCREGYAPLVRYLEAHPVADARSPIFRNRLGAPITVSGIEERLSRHGQLCGVDLTPHRLRHTYGRWMAESRLPVLSLARLLGHVSIQTTQRYIDGADPDVRRGYESAMGLHLTGAIEHAQVKPQAAPQAEAGPTTVFRQSPGSCPGEEWLGWAPDWLREGCLAWLRHQWPRWKASQRHHHTQNRLGELRLFWSWQLARRPFGGLDELTDDDVAAFTDAQLGRGLAAKTVKTTLDRVYELLRYLKDQGQLADLPERPVLQLPDPLPRHLEPGELLAIEGWIERRRQDDCTAETRLKMALYYLLGHAGLRISEALDLQVKDLDLASRRVRVRQGKGGRDRVVYLSSKAAQLLGEYLETVPHAAGDILLSRQGQALYPGLARRYLRRLGEKVGIQNLSPHRLRHTYATVLLNNGMGIEGLRRLMGHENLNTTLIYARLADTTLERQYRAAMDEAAARTEAAGTPNTANELLSVTLDNSM